MYYDEKIKVSAYDCDSNWASEYSNIYTKFNLFELGDEVFKVTDSARKVGKITEVHSPNSWGSYEYSVEFDGQTWYYLESELRKAYEVTGSKYNKHSPKCECGAFKVYGKKANNAVHALWCPVRK